MLKRRWWIALPLVLALALAAYWGLERYRYRFVHSNADLLHLLPAHEATVVYADMEALRRGGYLKLLAGSKESEDADYKSFVRDTGFDYTRDLNSVAGAVKDEEIWLALRGHFQWSKIRRYSESQHSARPIRIRQVQPDVLAVAISPNTSAVEQIRSGENNATIPSNAPVWVQPSKASLLNPTSLPLPVRIFAISLQSAESVVLALQPSQKGGAAFAISLNAAFRNTSETATARDQFEHATKLLKDELAREHHQPDPRDLAWLLLSGTFEASANHLRGSWPVRRELIESLR